MKAKQRLTLNFCLALTWGLVLESGGFMFVYLGSSW